MFRIAICSYCTVLFLLHSTTSHAAGVGTPEAIAEVLLDAMMRGDPQKAVALLPPDAVMADNFDCDVRTRAGDPIERVRAWRLDLPKNPWWAKTDKREISLISFNKEGKKTQTHKAAEELYGCRLKKAVGVLRAIVRITEKEVDRRPEEQTLKWTFLRLDGRWYFYPK